MGRRKNKRRSALGQAGFVLLEVILSLTILAFAVAAFMRSFTHSINAAKQMEIRMQATFFAQQLLEEFEIYPPSEGETEGGFGEAYKFYSYSLKMDYVDPKYQKVEGDEQIEQYFPLRKYAIEIHYDDGRMKKFTPVKIDSAIMGFEKFTFTSKVSYFNY